MKHVQVQGYLVTVTTKTHDKDDIVTCAAGAPSLSSRFSPGIHLTHHASGGWRRGNNRSQGKLEITVAKKRKKPQLKD